VICGNLNIAISAVSQISMAPQNNKFHFQVGEAVCLRPPALARLRRRGRGGPGRGSGDNPEVVTLPLRPLQVLPSVGCQGHRQRRPGEVRRLCQVAQSLPDA
jgi:hypothetical protein